MVDNKESVVPQRSLSTKVSCQTVLRSASEQLQYTHPHHSWVRKAAGWVSSSAVRKCLSGAGGIGWVLPAIGRVRACMVLAFTLNGKELRSLARVHINQQTCQVNRSLTLVCAALPLLQPFLACPALQLTFQQLLCIVGHLQQQPVHHHSPAPP